MRTPKIFKPSFNNVKSNWTNFFKTFAHWTYLLQILSKLCFQRVAFSGNYEIVAISTDKTTIFNDLDYKADIGQHFHKSEKSARWRHRHKIIKTNLKTHISPLPNRPQGCQGYQKNQKDLRITTMHYRKKYDKYMNFSTGWYACKVFLPPLGAIILNFSTMVQLTL